MKAGPDIALVASLVGDPARCNMLTALMSGRALTASELAQEAGVTPQTALRHGVDYQAMFTTGAQLPASMTDELVGQARKAFEHMGDVGAGEAVVAVTALFLRLDQAAGFEFR